MSRLVVVTGGAGGIGRALAVRFTAAGDTVALLDRDPAGLADACAAAGAHPYPVDLADPAAVAATFDRIGRDRGAPAVLVNNAAVRVFTPLLEIDPATWQAHQDVNLRAALLCAQHAARAMIAAGLAGCIVNISSIAAELPVRSNAAYGVAKAGLAALTRYLALELAPHRIRAVTVAPGPVATPLTAEAFAAGLGAALLERMTVREIADPADIAEVVHWVSSPGARFVNGTVVHADGGYTAT